MAESKPPKVTTAFLDRVNQSAHQRGDGVPTMTIDEACAAVAAASARVGSADEAYKRADQDLSDAHLALNRARAALRKATDRRIAGLS